MDVTRRELVIGGAAAAAFPAGCAAAATGGQFTPEAFGARGDGASDDYDAFQRLAAAVNATGGGTIALTPGRTYFLGRYKTPANGITDVTFRGCSGLMVDGQGATIATKGDFFRDARMTRGLSGLLFTDCNSVTISNLQLVGNVHQTRRTAGLPEAATHGLNFASCSDVIVDGVTVRHFAADGLYISASATLDSAGRVRASRRFSVRNSRFLFNARQGLSIIQLRDAVFENCDFSYTGYIDSQLNSSAYGHHAPSAGVDIEPDYTPSTSHPVDVLTGNLTFYNCRMVGNFGTTLSAGEVRGTEPAIDNVVVDACTLEASEASTSHYGLIFDVPGGLITGCTIRMHDKTAVLGWNPQSPASPRLSGNVIYGENARPDQPLLVVRRTRGSPLVQGNRFVVAGGAGRAASVARAQSVRVDNENAVMRDNQFVAQP